jgi:hypothetical protein
MAKEDTVTTSTRPASRDRGRLIGVRLQPDLLAALDAWIVRHPEIKLSRPEAIRQILAGTLATRRPSTILPNFVTGRDIVD